MSRPLNTRANDQLTIGRWVSARARLTPNRTAIEFCGRTISYQELDARSTRLAFALVQHGCSHGDRVATLTENRPEHVELLFACSKAGLILAPLNSHHSPPELATQLEAFAPRVVLASATHMARMREACTMVRDIDAPLPLEHLHDVLQGDPVHLELPSVADDDGLLLITTSGTTGTPKGAILTHANCFWTNLGFDLSVPLRDNDVVLQVLPQCHVGGWNVQPLLAWWKGATVVLEASFDPGRALELISKRGVTTMMGVPTNYLLMAQQPEFLKADLSSLRTVVVGGASMPITLLEQWHDRGIDVVQGYGLTEASPNVFCLTPEDAFAHAGSVGKPYSYVEVALYDSAADAFVEGVATGEVYVRGPNVFPGYWNNRDATAQVITKGWLRTGDVAERDADGYYRICGRTKEMYVSGGENVYPAEVEQVLVAFNDVIEAAVVAIDHSRWGETGVAFVVARPGADLDVDALLAHCRTRLANYKVPTEIRIMSELPRSHVGKLDKTRLKALLSMPNATPADE